MPAGGKPYGKDMMPKPPMPPKGGKKGGKKCK
jgi:hypothetical protein